MRLDPVNNKYHEDKNCELLPILCFEVAEIWIIFYIPNYRKYC